MKPFCTSARAASVSVLVFCRFACASERLACACASSARKLSDCRVARRSPCRTRSPTLTLTSVKRRPLASAPITDSCHAARLPFAGNWIGMVTVKGWTVVTVSEALAAAGTAVVAGVAGASAAHAGPVINPPPTATDRIDRATRRPIQSSLIESFPRPVPDTAFVPRTTGVGATRSIAHCCI